MNDLHPDDSKLIQEARRSGKLTPEQVEELRRAQQESSKRRISEIIVEKGYMSPDEVDALLRSPVPAPSHGPDTRFFEVPPDVAEARENPENLVGKYVRIREIGRGGFGSIWLAWDTALRRRIALKFLSTDDPENLERFKREARTAARLSHPNIVSIFEVGQHESRHFIAMEFIDGKDLTETKLDAHQAVAAVRDAARGVAHAHAEGIVHRDIKPHNLMRTETGRLCVMDFGLARQVKPGSSVTLTGVILGTPPYMSPEQATGQTATDTRIDVYGLGATLYELLTLNPPFLGATPVETLRMVIDEEPVPPRRHNPDISRDLETIVLKCLEKDPARRYASATSLADDLDRFLRNDPIEARRASIAYRVGKFARRHRSMVVTTSLLGLAVALALAGWARSAFKLRQNIAQSGDRFKGVAPLLDGAVEEIGKWDRLLDQRPVDITDKRDGLQRALADLDKALQLDPKSHEAHFRMAEIYERLGRRDDALGAIEQALKLAPGDARYLYERGLIRLAFYQQATSIYLLLSQLQIILSSDVLERLQTERKGHLALARADFEFALTRGLEKTKNRAEYARALIALAQGKFDDARDRLRRLADDTELGAEALKTLGDALAEQMTPAARDDASKCYRDAIGIRRCYFEAYAALGDLARSKISLLKMVNEKEFNAQTAESIQWFDQALKIFALYPNALAGRAITTLLISVRRYTYWESTGDDLSRAISDDCLRLVEQDSKNYMTYGLRALLYTLRALDTWDGSEGASRDVKNAEDDFRRGLSLNAGRNDTLASLLGLLLILEGNYKEAAAVLEPMDASKTIFGHSAKDWAAAAQQLAGGQAGGAGGQQTDGAFALMKLAGEPTRSVNTMMIGVFGPSPFTRPALPFYDRAFRLLQGAKLNDFQKIRLEDEYRHYLDLLSVVARKPGGAKIAGRLAVTACGTAAEVLEKKAQTILESGPYDSLRALDEIRALLQP